MFSVIVVHILHMLFYSGLFCLQSAYHIYQFTDLVILELEDCFIVGSHRLKFRIVVLMHTPRFLNFF